MRLSLSREEIDVWVRHMLSSAFHDADTTTIGDVVSTALDRTEFCFSQIALPAYADPQGAVFNHLHGDQTATFLYFASNSAWSLGRQKLASQLFLLNKMRNGLVCMYDTQLPDIFLLNHTVGTMLGKATYGRYFVAYHGVTVGTDRDAQPTIGEMVVMYPGSTISGSCRVGDRAVIAARANVLRTDIPDDTVASGTYPSLSIAPRKRDFAARYFRSISANRSEQVGDSKS